MTGPDTVSYVRQKDEAAKTDRKRQQAIERARDAVISAAKVAAFFGDEDASDPNLSELRRTINRLDKVSGCD